MLVINSNIMSLNAQRNLSNSGADLATSLQRLSSGLRINSAKDDAAGLAISERFTTQIRGMDQAARNANDGISLSQTAEGAMAEIGNNLQRIRELAVQSRNATNSQSDREALNAEAQQLLAEINRVADQTSFNGVKLLDGSFSDQVFQVGANQGETISIDEIVNASAAALGSWTSVDTPASVAGAAPVGSGGAAATGGTASFDSTSLVGVDFSTEQVSFDVGNGTDSATVTLEGNYADADALATAIGTDLGAAFNVVNNAGTIEITSVATGTGTSVTANNFNADADGNSTDSSVTALPTVTSADGTDATTASFDALAGTNFTINGTNIEVAAAADAATRLSDLATAINDAGIGVEASVSGGALQLSSDADIVIGGDAAATVLEQTGLTSGTTAVVAGTAQTGFDSLDISSAVGADNAMLAMDAALNAINSARAEMGAVQNRFGSVVANLASNVENLSAARSRIQDADFAKETALLTRNQILQQAGTAMLAQANQAPQGVLALLR